MATPLDPRVSEFETREQAESHDRWLRGQVRRPLEDSDPVVPHDEVMAEMEAIIEKAEQRSKRRS